MPNDPQQAPAGRSDPLGVVLAGGGSKRFGSEKSLFSLAGRPMARWVLDSLKPWTSAQVAIAPGPKMASVLGIPWQSDRIPGVGPLGGLHAALSWARDEGWERVFLLACDLPLVPPELIGRILRAWPPGVSAVIPESHGPLGLEPLCAGYEVSALPMVEEVIQGGRRSMMSALLRFEPHRIPASTLGTREELALAFTNVNDRQAAQLADSVLRGRSGDG